MSSEVPTETSPLVTSSSRVIGRVKWFNNKAGYGFITATDGPDSGKDVFVHHSGIMVADEQYKYLVQGEYVHYQTVHTPQGTHEYQAGSITGIHGGKLMCETRRELRENRAYDDADQEEEQPREVRMPRSTRVPNSTSNQSQPPKDGGEWTMSNSSRSQGGRGGGGGGGRGRGRPSRQKAQE